MEVDLALLAEHKLDTHQPRVNQKLQDTARAVFGLGAFSIMAASTPVESPTMYKPGGVLSLINGNIKGRMLSTGKDPLGRWVYLSLRRNTGPPLTIVTTYQVVDVHPRQAGPTTYATQLYATYLREGRQHPENLRLHHAQDLVAFIKQCQAREEWIIVAGDLNEVLGTTDRGLTRLHTECELLDACLERHGPREFTTYQRGTKVIDYILVDRNVHQCLSAVGYEPFGMHILSDHRGVFLDLAIPQCFGSNIQPLQPIQLRDLSTKRSHQIAPYFTEKVKHLEDHNWFMKLQQLKDTLSSGQIDNNLAEDLYERLVSASVHAGSTLKKFPPAPYSPTIAKLRNVHRILTLAVTQFKTRRDMSEHIARIKAKLGNAGYELPATAELCKQALIRCTRQLKAAIQEEVDTRYLRKQHQEKLITEYEQAGNTKLAKKIRGMK